MISLDRLVLGKLHSKSVMTYPGYNNSLRLDVGMALLGPSNLVGSVIIMCCIELCVLYYYQYLLLA